MYCRHQTCDHTIKIIKRNTKGKLSIKYHIIKELKEVAVSNPVTRGNSLKCAAEVRGVKC